MMMPPTPTLEDLGRRYGTGKVHHGYLPHLDALLDPLRDEVFDLLEIGVKDGASIRMWHDYFPRAHIVGLDVHPVAPNPELPRATFVQGNQADADLLDSLADRYQFRVIIDDGSHIWPHQIASFQHLFPRMRHHGLYVVEDLHTSYGAMASRYSGGTTESAASWFLRLINGTISAYTDVATDQAIARRPRSIIAIPRAVIITT